MRESDRDELEKDRLSEERSHYRVITIASVKRTLSRSALLVFIAMGLLHSFQIGHGAPTWSDPSHPLLVDFHSGNDKLPSALQAANGTLWVAFQSDRNDPVNRRTDIFYRTYTNTVWSAAQNLTGSGWNTAPTLLQLWNGTILAFWSLKSGNSYLVFSGETNGRSWSRHAPITSTVLNDTQPSAAVARDGTIWLVWTRINSTCTSCTAIKQLFYKTWKSGVWSPEIQLTNDSNQNYGSGVTASKDGIIRVTWSKGAPGATYQLFSKTFNGVAWSSETQIVSSTSTDERPSMIQDRNGTLWLFWGRLVVVSLLVQYYQLVGKYSYDLGATWSSEIPLSNTSTSVDSFMPSAVQSGVGSNYALWVFYTSNLGEPSYAIYALSSSGITNIHDVQISGLTASNNLGTNWQYPGGLTSVGQSAIETITVTVANIGDYLENVNITLTATNTSAITVGSHKSFIGSGGTVNFYFYWNTTNIKAARYGLYASIAGVSYSFGNTGDNGYGLTNQIHILPLGDIDQDGSVTITDVSVFIYDYGFSPSCNCSRWNPYADVRGDGFISLADFAILVHNYDTFT